MNYRNISKDDFKENQNTSPVFSYKSEIGESRMISF